MPRPANPDLTKAKIKELCNEYTIEAAAQILGITPTWLKRLRKKYGLVKTKKGVKKG